MVPPDATVLIPYRDAPGRRAAFEWVTRRWALLLPEYELIVCGDKGWRFNLGRAVNAGARAASAPILLLASADLCFDPNAIRQAVERCARTGDWLIPDRYYHLTPEASERLLRLPPDTLRLPRVKPGDWERRWIRESLAEVNVVPAAAYAEVGGHDERYDGWGLNDMAFAKRMDVLYRPHARYLATMLHLWHPRTQHHDSNPHLSDRYRTIGDDPDRMRALIER